MQNTFCDSVAGPPTELAVNKTNLSIQVSWTAPLAPVSGYEVFYVTAAGETHSAGNTTDTNLTVSDLSDVCSVFVVAYGGDSTSEHILPSEHARISLNSESVLHVFLVMFTIAIRHGMLQ